MTETQKITAIAALIFSILTVAAYASFRYAKERTGTLVLPGGITYLGQSPGPQPIPPAANSSTITVPAGTAWSVYKGKLFPYSFSYPSNLSLGVFPNDPFDGVTIFWGNTNAQNNLLLRVENLNKIASMDKYLSKPKLDYVNNWWRQYGLKGVGTVTQFTNSQGLTGYRARFAGANFDNVFFEIPGHPELVIWTSTKLLDQTTFDKIVDSISWKK